MKKIILTLIIIHCSLLITQAQWQIVKQWTCGATQVNCFKQYGSNLFSGTWDGSIYFTSNDGITWESRSSGIPPGSLIYSIDNIDSTLFIGSNKICKSSNMGLTWISLTNFPYSEHLISYGTDLYASNAFIGVIKSTNYGLNWDTINNGLTNITISAFGSNSSYIFTGRFSGSGSSIHRTSNGGINWEPINSSMPSGSIYSIVTNSSIIFAGTSQGVFRSMDNGLNWRYVLSIPYVRSVVMKDQKVFAGSSDSNIYYSPDTGNTWVKKSEGIVTNPSDGIYSLIIKGDYIFAGGFNYIYRRPLSEITEIIHYDNEFPETISLSQNYPNPFNPTTTIKFEVPLSKGGLKGVVSLSVFDILGKEVATLVNELLSPGTYSVDWNASQYPSGVYFYRLTTEGFSETKKMLLIK